MVFGIRDKIVMQEGITFPLIVKPAREDASVGIDDLSVVYTLADLRKRVRFIQTEYDQPALAEEYIDGRELNVAILGNKPPVALPISEIDFCAPRYFMAEVSVVLAPGNFSKVKRGIFVTT